MLSLLPPLVKTVLGGNEEVVTAFLAIFSIAIAVGSGLAAWLAHGRIVLLPTADRRRAARASSRSISAFATYGAAPAATAGVAQSSASCAGIRIAIDLAGLAIAGGLFIVPVFAAVQAWAGADRRARVIAAVNVLNAGFMVVGTLVRRGAAEASASSLPQLFLLLGVANIVVAVWIARTMPRERASATSCRSSSAPSTASR